MEKEVKGTVVSVSRQWWFKVNTKPLRTLGTDGAVYPHVVKFSYVVDGREYTKRKWIGAGLPVPAPGSTVTVIYPQDDPARARML